MFIAERPYKHTLSSSLQLTFKEWYKSKLKTSATSRLQNKENEIYNLDPFHFFFSFCAAHQIGQIVILSEQEVVESS